MAQLSDDCFAFGGALTPAADALAQLESAVHPVAETETVGLRAANGRILAETIVSERAVPPHDNAAVDGYAVYFEDLDLSGDTRLPCTGRVAAGHPLGRPALPGEAIRVFTGAPMPRGDAGSAGPDTVLMQEDCRLDGDDVIVPPGIKRGANRRNAGEDVKAGTTILTAGRALRPQDIGLAASVGRTELAVFRRLRVAIFSTGDEVYEPGAALGDGGIYDANRYVIASLAERLGCAVTDMGILPDNLDVIRDALTKASQDHDLLLTSGGMSTGDEDHVKAAVEALGHLHFWRLAIRPGRPIALGQVGRVPFVGLPGNPVAVMVTFLRFARPLILRLGGCSDVEPAHYKVPVDFNYKKKRGRREWLRARLTTRPDGTRAAEKFARDGAGILSSAVFADGLIELPEDLTSLSAGTMVDFLPFNEMYR
jgi:molybdopterin molybdotransferase